MEEAKASSLIRLKAKLLSTPQLEEAFRNAASLWFSKATLGDDALYYEALAYSNELKIRRK